MRADCCRPALPAVLAIAFADVSVRTAGTGFCADDAVRSRDSFEHADYIVFAEVERTEAAPEVVIAKTLESPSKDRPVLLRRHGSGHSSASRARSYRVRARVVFCSSHRKPVSPPVMVPLRCACRTGVATSFRNRPQCWTPCGVTRKNGMPGSGGIDLQYMRQEQGSHIEF
jgi:hypothetical protein